MPLIKKFAHLLTWFASASLIAHSVWGWLSHRCLGEVWEVSLLSRTHHPTVAVLLFSGLVPLSLHHSSCWSGKQAERGVLLPEVERRGSLTFSQGIVLQLMVKEKEEPLSAESLQLKCTCDVWEGQPST